MEIGGLAINPGGTKEIAWLPEDPARAQSVKANGLVFASGVSGLADPVTGAIVQELYGDPIAQTHQVLKRLDAALNRFDSSLENALRLDVFLDNIYFEDTFIELAKQYFGGDPPTMNIVGADLENNAEIEISCIAGA